MKIDWTYIDDVDMDQIDGRKSYLVSYMHPLWKDPSLATAYFDSRGKAFYHSDNDQIIENVYAFAENDMQPAKYKEKENERRR